MNSATKKAMTEHLAVDVLKGKAITYLTGMHGSGESGYYYDIPGIKYLMHQLDFDPFENAAHRDLVVGALHRVIITKHHNRRYEAWVYNTDKDGFPDGSCIAVDAGNALCNAACRATGFPINSEESK